MPIASRSLAALLSIGLVLPPLPAQGADPGRDSPVDAAAASPLTRDQRVLHALNRLTFGPRPGDVAAVEAMGLDRWIDRQLHPETIDDSALDARLAAYPAMHLSLHDLMQRFPSPAVIRQAERGRLPVPGNPVERAIYNDQIANLRERQARQAQNRQPINPSQPTPARAASAEQGTAPSASMGDSMAPPAPDMLSQSADLPHSDQVAAVEEKLYADLDATSIVNLPPQQRVAKLLAMPPDDFRGFLQHLNRPSRVALFAGLSPEQRETVFALINPQLVVGGELLVTRLLRDLESERQLQAVMTDFWLNHFNIYLRKGPFEPWYLVTFQDQVVRPHALGKFEDLLVATARSPAMLFYLDQSESVGPHSLAAMRAAMAPPGPNGRQHTLGLNENYARELMELHTLGVDGGYTQRDVIELAKVFSGWGIERPGQGGQFTFNPRRHEPGPKFVLGHKISDSGEQEGLRMLHILATSPATAHHVSFQIAQRFVSDNPPSALVDTMTATWLKTGGDIREVLRTMLRSPQFWSHDAYRAKVKTPEEYVLSAVRASGGEVLNPAALVEALAQLGMPLYGCQTPNGYPWTARAWLNSGELLDRMNFSLALADDDAGAWMHWDDRLSTDAAAPVAGKETRLESLLLDEPASPQTRQAVLQQASDRLNSQAGPQSAEPRPAGFIRPREFGPILAAAPPLPRPHDRQAALLAGLLLGSPEFQRR